MMVRKARRDHGMNEVNAEIDCMSWQDRRLVSVLLQIMMRYVRDGHQKHVTRCFYL